MLTLTTHNCPEPEKFDTSLLPADDPEFVTYQPNTDVLTFVASNFSTYSTILIIGHGGSVTSFYALWSSLGYRAKHKHVEFVSSVDPEFLNALKARFTPEDTLVLVISKSGENITVVEACLAFYDYPMLFIAGAGSTIARMAEAKGSEIIEHPSGIGGRFAGLTEVGLLPAVLCGIDINALVQGGKKIYQLYREDNPAWKLASILQQLEEKNYVDVLWGSYGSGLSGFGRLITQLFHETFGKDDLGQTILTAEGPEFQHHTQQRYFGGRKNMVGCFVTIEKQESFTLTVPESLKAIPLKDHTLAGLEREDTGNAMKAEFTGTYDEAVANKMPVMHLSLTGSTAEDFGEYMAFCQLAAVYGALLRNVEPFDQPAVEASKARSVYQRFGEK